MTPWDAVLLVAAGFLAGAVNAVAGGGSLLSFPALLAAGYPAVTANVTNTVALWPGYLSGIAGFRAELEGQAPRLRSGLVPAVLGAVVGVVLLLALPNDAFDAAVPWCVLFAAGLLAAQPRVSAWVRRRAAEGEERRSLGLDVTLFLSAVYGAYFGGALGVVLLALLGVYLSDHLHRIIGLKNAFQFLINSVALVAFVAFAPVSWSAFAVVAPASLLGGFVGARVARRVPAAALRVTIVVVGTLVGIVLLVR